MLQLALTPSANDIFTFHAMIKGLSTCTPALTPGYFDLQDINEAVLAGEPDVCKISMFTLGHILKDYVLLPVGAALGYGNGPKIVARQPFKVEELMQKSMAIPGKDTTAYLLANVLLEKVREEVFCPYPDIMPRLQEGEVDCALLIHESRFSIAAQGLHEIADLGALWEEKTSCPLPLGGVVARRSLGDDTLLALCQSIQASLAHALEHPQASRSLILDKGFTGDPQLIDSYIKLYVNAESWHLSSTGTAAIEQLLTCGRSLGLLPVCDEPWLFTHPSLATTPPSALQ